MTTAPPVQRLREGLTLALFCLLPFHALLITVATRLLAGPGRAPLGALAVWKEGLLLIVAGLALVETVTARRWRPDRIDLLVAALAALSLLVTWATHGDLRLAALGFKYDLLAPCTFLVLRRVPWSESFVRRALTAILVVGAAVAAFGIVSLLLPRAFFTWLGYSDAYSLYFPGKPLTSFQLLNPLQIRRVQSVMSGPNQLGTWLLLPWALGLTGLLRGGARRWRFLALTALVGAALALSFSRAAWIAASVIALVTALRVEGPWKARLRSLAPLIAGTAIVLVAVALFAFPQALVRLGSSRGHVERPIEAVRRMIASPFGEGLGSAGPASHRVSDVCVFLRSQDDPSWAAVHPELCVYTGDTQVQPVGRTCRCPFLPENWYLQIGVEAGVIGFVLFLLLTAAMLRAFSARIDVTPGGRLAQAVGYAFLGVCVVGLFLHAWEDAAVSYGTWLLAAAVLPSGRRG